MTALLGSVSGIVTPLKTHSVIDNELSILDAFKFLILI
ncbi:hypothetical protein LPE509_00668 [Legionella pneumophila subsp. pneumophila LPE509]|nr:hypothetical protein LPE509_00668 [Legionella pneumophila subsp. pneumophila LPE509]